MALLETRHLTKHFHGLIAVANLDLMVEPGEIVGLIGPNGAGKSTTLNMISGTLRPTKGTLWFDGADITRLAQHRRARRGIARVFQHDVFFQSLTVLENVLVGFHARDRVRLGQALFGGATARQQAEAWRAEALQILERVGLAHLADRLAVNLPHGHQRLLSLAVALITQPKLLLLDEPLAGLNAIAVDEMLALIHTLRDETGLAAILVEHNIRAVMSGCDRIYVMSFGRQLAAGSPEEIAANPKVVEAYLGAEQHAA